MGLKAGWTEMAEILFKLGAKLECLTTEGKLNGAG